MDMSYYQEQTKSTAIYPKETGLYYTALGLSGEVGETCGKISKVLRDDKQTLSDERRLNLLDECGDILWFLARLVDELSGDLNKVALDNLNKLQSRANRGKISGSGDNR